MQAKDGTTLWASGRTNALGVILNGVTDQVLPSEEPIKNPRGPFQPHYQTITRGDQVQIYQELIKDSAGNLTTSFMRRVHQVKDNRLRPRGFDPQVLLDNPSPYIQLVGEIDGEAKNDPYYFDPRLTGADQITYRMTLDPSAMARAHHVEVTLYSQSIPPGYLQERFRDASVGPKRQDEIRRLFYLTSHLNTAAADNAGDPYIESWKLAVADACQAFTGACQP